MFVLLFSILLLFPAFKQVSESIYDKELNTKKVIVKDILANYNEISENAENHYISKGKEVLGFITPWNKDGYTIAEEFGDKFSIIVPTWLFAEMEGKKFVIKGTDAVNETWMKNMKEKHPDTIIAPRLIFQIHPQIFYNENKYIFNVFRQTLADVIKQYNFEAIFLEVPNYVMVSQTCQYVPALVKEIRYAFGKKNKGKVYCEIPTILRGYADQEAKNLKRIADQSDLVYMSVYELPQTAAVSPMPGLDATIEWLKSSRINPKKFIAGFPFFGFDYGNGSGREYVTGQDFINTLSKYKVTPVFLKEYQETAYFYSKDRASHTLYYPSISDLYARFEKTVSTGIAGFGIWELAQGLPYFYDLL